MTRVSPLEPGSMVGHQAQPAPPYHKDIKAAILVLEEGVDLFPRLPTSLPVPRVVLVSNFLLLNTNVVKDAIIVP